MDRDVLPLPVSILQREGELDAFKASVRSHGAGYLFFQDKLGGEISITGTSHSPEMAFDVTLVEIVPTSGDGFAVSRYGILEIQTMDFHGTYKNAVGNLRDALRLHPKNFPTELQNNPNWAGEKVEGPNIANVFKRTFYQVMVKFKLSGQGSAAAGTVLALPKSVWDSWQPFLGAPALEDETTDVKRFRIDDGGIEEEPLNAFICVFDLDASSESSVSPLQIEYFVRVSPERLAHHAFTQVPNHILHAIQSKDSVLTTIRSRLSDWWPDFQPLSPGARSSRRRPKDAAGN
ncbi:PDDEXK family nuclease [Paraburkholderia sediminicola]|uniref:hypothetical protein n=1 Tax=Paraburkholderia sediminicola TaxID=458836 RepID=UPI0038B6B35D